MPGLTQVRPDLLVLVSEGPYGEGTYYLEFERRAVQRWQVAEKPGTLPPHGRHRAATAPADGVPRRSWGRRTSRRPGED